MKKFLNASRYLFLFYLLSFKAHSETVESSRIQILEVAPFLLNFSFPQFRSFWMTQAKDWEILWKEHSRVSGPAPQLPVQWDQETVLALFWEGKQDHIVRIPSFVGSEVSGKRLRLSFYLNTPCVGIITDTSPAQLIVFNRQIAEIDSLLIRMEVTRTVNCY